MPLLQVSHDSLDSLPESIDPRELYTERDGKFVLTGITGVKTQADVDAIKGYLQEERNAHKDTKKKLHAFDGMDSEELQTKLDRLAELEVLTKGQQEDFDSKLEELTEARVRSRVSPLEREVKKKDEAIAEMAEELAMLRTAQVQRTILDDVRAAATEANLPAEALADAELLAENIFIVDENTGKPVTKENRLGFTDGVEADVFFTELKEKRPHWWPASRGGDAPGSGRGSAFPNNPWSDKHWNMTEQGKVFKAQGREKAEQMAKAAGTTIGGPRPTSDGK